VGRAGGRASSGQRTAAAAAAVAAMMESGGKRGFSPSTISGQRVTGKRSKQDLGRTGKVGLEGVVRVWVCAVQLVLLLTVGSGPGLRSP
jgi:hypothetical protein